MLLLLWCTTLKSTCMTYMEIIVLALDAQRHSCNDMEYMPLILRFEALKYMNYLEQ